MKLYVIRHGESETNRAGCWTGWLDAPLTEKGREDALFARAVLAGVPFDEIYASDLARAKDTAEIALPGCSYTTEPLLREINVGEIAGKPLATIADGRGGMKNSGGYGDYGGETEADFVARVAAIFHRFETEEARAVALFSHSAWLKAALDFVLKRHLPVEHISCRNCTVAIFEYVSGRWKLHSWINP